jgi:hypothetical protein
LRAHVEQNATAAAERDERHGGLGFGLEREGRSRLGGYVNRTTQLDQLSRGALRRTAATWLGGGGASHLPTPKVRGTDDCRAALGCLKRG